MKKLEKTKTAAKLLYRKAVNLFEKNGSWNELQMTQHCAERIGLIHYGLLSHKSNVGFNVLGLSGMAMIRDRDEVRERNYDLSSYDSYQRIKKIIRNAEKFGLYHECWKWSWIALWKCKMSFKERRSCLCHFLQYFTKTEYHPIMRITQLFYSLMPYRVK